MGRRTIPAEAVVEFWAGIRLGLSSRKAAAVAGVSHETGRRWFRDAGGVMANADIPPAPGSVSGRFLSLAEREEIALGIARGETNTEIAARLGRDKSTIGREIDRTVGHVLGTDAAGGDVRHAYRAVLAHELARERGKRPKPAKLVTHQGLRDEVESRLDKNWSPVQISKTLARDFPGDPEMRISHEAVYQSLFVQARGALLKELTACLRTGRAVRKPHSRAQAQARASKLGEVVSISERPAEAEDRAVAGHWEGDLILGKGNQSAVGTLVDRRSRFVLLLHLPDGHSAVQVRDAMIPAIQGLDEQLRKTLTWDRGAEMARHAEISVATNIKIYFADPHSPWQRGTNENTNGLLRQYLPKGTDLSQHSAERLAEIAAELNNRPRETLEWETPADCLNRLLLLQS